MKDRQSHRMSYCNKGSFSASTRCNFTVFSIIKTFFVTNGSTCTFNKCGLKEFIAFTDSCVLLFPGTFVALGNQTDPRGKSISRAKLAHYDPSLGNNSLRALQSNPGDFIQQCYLLGSEFCFFLISSSNVWISVSIVRIWFIWWRSIIR
mgnify:CR=1 FL=1